MASLELKAAAFGNLSEFMQEESERAASAISRGTDKARATIIAELRAQVMSAFGSQRLANTWRGQLFPRLPETSMGAAATIWSNAPHIVEAFSAATVIRSSNGMFLAIPSPEVPRQRANMRLTPDNWPEAQYGPLRFVYRPGQSSLLVLDDIRYHTGKRKGFVKASAAAKAKGRTASTIMFFLVPFVRLKQKLDPQSVFARAVDLMLNDIVEAWQE